jgi:asparagine synthase (glutamine-hydrolysing)
MCGICGILRHQLDRPVPRAELERMNDALRHRGPDSSGFAIEGQVGLAMRRLAIIDLTGGEQPISNEDGSCVIVFNGEIYNFEELHVELESRGHRFRTRSDTETILHAYEEFGDDCPKYLRGMFAFAIWDSRQKRLFAARDRFGKKPFYYGTWDDTFWFASELAALKRVPGFPAELDPEAIHHYLTLQHVPEPSTGLRGIKKLAPAHVLIWENGTIETKRYWQLQFEPKDKGDFEMHRAAVRAAVEEAVRVRLVSEVPLGAHLSGGLDSSIIVGIMSRVSTHRVRTFSIGFDEEGFDESQYAESVARHFGTEHETFRVHADAAELLPKMVAHFGEPFADPAALPTWLLAERTRRHVTVALNGDGGDEAFAGYQRYFADRYANALHLFPSALRRLGERLATFLPTRDDLPMERRRLSALGTLFRAAEYPPSASIVRWGSYFDERQKNELYEPDWPGRACGPTWLLPDAIYRRAPGNRVDRTLATDLELYLPGALLPKVDRMTMAMSLEARSPFLDHRLMELAARLPVDRKVRGLQGKIILRAAFRDLLPPEIAGRRKQGFGLPIAHWLRGPLTSLVCDTLLSESAAIRGILRPDVIARFWSEHQSGRHDHSKRLWALLNLELWLRWLNSRTN